MAYGYNAGFEDDPVDEIPQNVTEKSIESSLDIQQQEYKETVSLTKKIEEERKEYLTKLRNIVTDAKWPTWTQTRLKHRQELRYISTKANPTYEGGVQIQEKRKELISKGERFRRDIGLDITRATQLRDQHTKRIEKIFKKAWEIPDTPTFLLSKGPSNNPHPWEIFNPPFSGGGWSYSWYRSDEPATPMFTRYLDSQAGQIGSYSYIRVFGADNHDVSYVRYHTGVRFWYKMPAAGIFELWLKLQAIYDDFWGDTDDEWGWSGVSVSQFSRPYVRVISPLGNVRYGDTSIFSYNCTGHDWYWDRHVMGAGKYKWAYVLSDAAYPANQWIRVEAGVYDDNYFWSNDVTVRSKMNMKWFVPGIWIRKKP